MKKTVSAILLSALLILCVGGITSLAYFGVGAEVMAEEIQLVKTGLLGKKLRFSDVDFKCAFNVDDFDSVEITKLPSSQEGSLLLAGRRVKEGQKIKRSNVASLVFVPSNNGVTQSSFSYVLRGVGIEKESECILKFIDKINYAPKAQESEESSLSVTTQREISYIGSLKMTDPEGDALEYLIVNYPDCGSISFIDKTAGVYKYTPLDDFTGYDSFTFVARDCYGNYSAPKTVNVKTVARMSETVYSDMLDRAEYNAAVAMTAMGVMGGKTLGDGSYFCPDETVSKAEFVAMAMKSYGLRADSSVKSSFFDDDNEIPSPLVSYVATAQLLGIIDGDYTESGLVFNPNDEISLYQAASIMSKILGIKTDGENETYMENETVPSYAKADVSAMFTLGIFEGDCESFDGTVPVTRASAAEYLYKMANY